MFSRPAERARHSRNLHVARQEQGSCGQAGGWENVGNVAKRRVRGQLIARPHFIRPDRREDVKEQAIS